MVLGQVNDGHVRRHDQRAIIGLADRLMHFQLYIAVVPVVIGHGEAGLDCTHDLAKTLRRGVDHRGYPVGLLVGEAGNTHPLFWAEEALMYHHVGAFGFFQEPFIGRAITAEDKAQAFPVEAEADRAVHDVDGGKTGDLDAILVVDDRGFAEVKFVGDDFATGIGQGAGAGIHIPRPGGADVIDMGFGTQLGAGAGGTIDMKWGITTTYPAAYPKGGNITDMVGVQMTGKDLVQFRVVRLTARPWT